MARPDSVNSTTVVEDKVYTKMAWRLVPVLFICYIAAYLDRVNIAFAELQMKSDLKFSDTVYGLGAGIFFIGYFFFEVPSNILLEKVGARIWIARIMVSWGIVSGLMVFVRSPQIFYLLRFMLGVAEAGFFPGIILYRTFWFPSSLAGFAGPYVIGKVNDQVKRPDFSLYLIALTVAIGGILVLIFVPRRLPADVG